jgi:hypothetical protein
MSGKAQKSSLPQIIALHQTDSCNYRISDIPNEFVPLYQLIHSLDNNRRLYFLYRQAAQTGSKGAQLRFQQLIRTIEPAELRRIESSFKTHRPVKRTA